jgi:hypothetical protein
MGENVKMGDEVNNEKQYKLAWKTNATRELSFQQVI